MAPLRLRASLILAASFLACGGSTTTETVRDSGPPRGDAGHGERPDSHLATSDDTGPPAPDAGMDASIPMGPGVLLFAGYGEAPLNDTWLFTGSAWNEIDDGDGTHPAPSIRSDQSMIGFDGKVLLFGGEGLGPELGDTWVWDGKWTELTIPGPSPREGGAVGVLNGKVILFGGESSSGASLADTWQWDGTSWTELQVTGPTNRLGASMAALGDQLVLFGSIFDTATWLFDGTTWTMSPAPGPTGDPDGPADTRTFQTMATLGDVVVLFGGEQDANHILNDTWTFDGTTWTKLTIASSPPERFHAGMTAFDGKLVLYGGAGAIPAEPGFLGDTWTFDGTTWTEVSMGGPSPRYGYTLAAWMPE
jgi:hypothetical protein